MEGCFLDLVEEGDVKNGAKCYEGRKLVFAEKCEASKRSETHGRVGK